MSKVTKSQVQDAETYLSKFDIDLSTLDNDSIVNLESETKGQVSFLERAGVDISTISTIEMIQNIYHGMKGQREAGKKDALLDGNLIGEVRQNGLDSLAATAKKLQALLDELTPEELNGIEAVVSTSKKLDCGRVRYLDSGTKKSHGFQYTVGTVEAE